MASHSKQKKTIRRARDAKKLIARRKRTAKKNERAIRDGETIDIR